MTADQLVVPSDLSDQPLVRAFFNLLISVIKQQEARIKELEAGP